MVEAASSAKLERDDLQRHVFPRLRKLREANNARFQAIDLRWGVPNEAKAEGKRPAPVPAGDRALPAGDNMGHSPGYAS